MGSKSSKKKPEPKTSTIAEKGIEWARKEETVLDETANVYKMTLEAKFVELMKSLGDTKGDGFDKDMLWKLFRTDFKLDISSTVFDKLFNLMDCDGNGTVDQHEFTVTMCFLLQKGSAHDNVELAYNLFDTNKDGSISKSEFSEMISAILGPRLKNILEIPGGRESFKQFVAQEYATELFEYYEEMEDLKKQYLETGIPTSIADSVITTYINVDSELQINISANEREAILAKVNEIKEKDGDKVPYEVFKPALLTSIGLLEQGALVRFKLAIKEPPYEMFTMRAWDICELGADDTMTLEKFKEFCNKTPNLFSFLDELSEELEYDLMKA